VPSSDEVADAGKSRPAKARKACRPTLLLCEDNPLNQEIAKALLAERPDDRDRGRGGRNGAELSGSLPSGASTSS
jgi:hypothetical protein